jgi:hypothetical protein
MMFMIYNIIMSNLTIKDEWPVLKRFLPDAWEEKAFKLGALKRKRKIVSPDTLLRVLFIHLADGKSLRTTAAYAHEAGLCSVNDVALLHRLKASGEWFRWMAMELIEQTQFTLLPEQFFSKFNIRLVDGTVIKEPGSTGTDWRIHYCVQLASLRCDYFHISDPSTGESLVLYPVEKDDLIIGDRGYCHRKGIMHVLKNKGQVMLRFHSTNLPLFKRSGTRFNVLNILRSLGSGKIGDWDVWFRDPVDNQQLVKGRICAIRKSDEAIEIAKKALRQRASKKGNKLRAETLEYAEYVIIFSTLNRHNFKANEILTLYRGRWQIELVFKRLKSIAKVGHLPKTEDESCTSWLHGKMVIALLAERLHQEAEFISPWGYPLSSPRQREFENG